jgi:hypothetical protein
MGLIINMVALDHYLYFTVHKVFTEYFGLNVAPFLRLGLGTAGLGFMCAIKKQKYYGHIHLQ